MKFCQSYHFKELICFFVKVEHIWKKVVVLFSFICGGFLALNLSIHLNFTQCGSCCLCTCVRSFVCICTLTCVTRVLEMTPKQQWVDFAFIPISKEEREMDIEREFAALSEQGVEPLTRQHATSYGALTWLELKRVQNSHLFI